VFNGLINRHVANNARDRGDQRIRICGGVDEKAAAKDGTFFKGTVERDDWLRNDVLVVYVGRDADDAVRRGVESRSELQHRTSVQ